MRLLGDTQRGLKHFAGTRIDRHRRGRRRAMQSRQVAGRFMKAHQAMHGGDLGERRVDRGARAGFGESADANLYESA